MQKYKIEVFDMAEEKTKKETSEKEKTESEDSNTEKVTEENKTENNDSKNKNESKKETSEPEKKQDASETKEEKAKTENEPEQPEQKLDEETEKYLQQIDILAQTTLTSLRNTSGYDPSASYARREKAKEVLEAYYDKVAEKDIGDLCDKCDEIANKTAEKYNIEIAPEGYDAADTSKDDIIMDEIKSYIIKTYPKGANKSSLSPYQQSIIKELQSIDLTTGDSDDKEEKLAQKTELFSKLVSDNYDTSHNNKKEAKTVTQDYFKEQGWTYDNDIKNYDKCDKYDGENKKIEFDTSEMTTFKKTNLARSMPSDKTSDFTGEFVPTGDLANRSDRWDRDAENKEKRELCGGVIEFVKTEDSVYSTQNGGIIRVDGGDNTNWGGPFHQVDYADHDIAKEEEVGQIVHYKGVLGDFEYNTRLFELGYFAKTINGQDIMVPCLHYRGDQTLIDSTGTAWSNTNDPAINQTVKIPDGVACADYMFANTSIKRMPELPDSIVSAHCMFAGCKDMETVEDNCKGQKDGSIKYPQHLQDVSWMFTGSNMRYSFDEMGEKLLDARWCFADCDHLGFMNAEDESKTDDDGEYHNIWVEPDYSKCRYITSAYVGNMFDGCNASVIEKLSENHANDKKDIFGNYAMSQWTDGGLHDNIMDKIDDGSWNEPLSTEIKNNADLLKLQKMMDPEGPGTTGVESDTAGMATTSVQLTPTGNKTDSTTLAKFRQDDVSIAIEKDNPLGKVLDRGLAFGAIFAGSRIASGLLMNKFMPGNEMAGKISTLASLGIAGITQFTCASKLSPIIKSMGEFIGDNAVGNALKNFASKFEDGVEVKSTEIKENNIEEIFKKQQNSSSGFAANQLNSMMQRNSSIINDAVPDYIGFQYNVSDTMRQNGKNLVDVSDVITISLTKDSDLRERLDHNIMREACNGIYETMKEDKKKSGYNMLLDKDEYVLATKTLMKNLSAYSDGMLNGVKDTKSGISEGGINAKYGYGDMAEYKDKAINGMEKVIRNSSMPVYEMIAKMQAEENVFTDQEIKELEAFNLPGMPKLSEYIDAYNKAKETQKPVEIKNEKGNTAFTVKIEKDTGKYSNDTEGKVYIDAADADKYVKEREKSIKSFEEAMKEATTAEAKNELVKEKNRTLYGYLIAEAEAHDVVLDDESKSKKAEEQAKSADDIIDKTENKDKDKDKDKEL